MEMLNEKCCEAITKEVCCDDKTVVNLYFNKGTCDGSGSSGSNTGNTDFTEDELAMQKAALQWSKAELNAEYWTGKHHVNGKKIYGKKIDCGPLPNAGAKRIPHGIINFDRTISIYAISTDSSGTIDVQLSLPNMSDVKRAMTIARKGDDIELQAGIDRSSEFPLTLATIEYTCTDR